MKMEELRSIAKARGIKPGQFSKAELIKYIQADEGNFDCYATAYNGECDQGSCLWRDDCFTTSCREQLS